MSRDCVAVDSFVNEMSAELARAKLEASGVEAFLSPDNCGGVRPDMQAGTGIRVMVAEEDVERARDVLSKKEELALPPDFVPPPVPEEPVRPLNPYAVLGFCILGAAAVLGLVFSREIAHFILSVMSAPNYEFVLVPAATDDATVARVRDVIAGRLQAAEIPCRIELADNAQLRLAVKLSDKATTNSVRELLRRHGDLRFRLVHKQSDTMVAGLFVSGAAPKGYVPDTTSWQRCYRRDPGVPDGEAASGEELGAFRVPSPAYEFMLMRKGKDEETVCQPYFVKRRAEMTGEHIENASVKFDGMGRPMIAIAFDAKGAKQFAHVTGDHAPGGARNPDVPQGRQLAIVLDGILHSAPVIKQAIFGGKAEISGAFSMDEAEVLASVLRAGILPCPVEIVGEREL